MSDIVKFFRPEAFVKSIIVLLFLTTASSSFACTVADVKAAEQKYNNAQDRFKVGETTSVEVAAAKTELYVSQACLEIDNGSLTCEKLTLREQTNLEHAVDQFKVGEITFSQEADFANRVSAASALCE